MNPHNQSWRTFRLNRGLRWRKNYPSLPDFPKAKTALIIALCVFGVIALICAVHYQNEATDAVIAKDKAVSNLLGCMNGTQQWSSDDGYDIACMKAVINKRKV